ncbi:MAG: hypothetical protein JNK72_14160 [Myxococcales bacterium]|nr:hypothetical protein [Myxococcales bacterium]
MLRALALACAIAATGCAAYQRGDGLSPSVIPPELQADYELFASRCSRCHSLARPLGARVSSAAHWQAYVTRMQRQPGSGISPDDQPGILRFLAWYSANRHREDVR